jgi:nitrate reductase NapAB chaperone NapD
MEGGRGIYETIIAILDKDQQPVQPTEIINKVKQITAVRIVFEEIEEEDDVWLSFPLYFL